jgi:cysteine synthase A
MDQGISNSSTIRSTSGHGRLFDSVIETIGDTPCIRINRLAPEHVQLYVKAEFFNPGGSSKTASRSTSSKTQSGGAS